MRMTTMNHGSWNDHCPGLRYQAAEQPANQPSTIHASQSSHFTHTTDHHQHTPTCGICAYTMAILGPVRFPAAARVSFPPMTTHGRLRSRGN